jgi:chromosome segregation ATPase
LINLFHFATLNFFLLALAEKDKESNEAIRKQYENMMSSLKGDQMSISERLKSAQMKLANTENDATHAKSQIDEKQRQIDVLRRELDSFRAKCDSQMRLLEAEKNEKEKLFRRCDQLEATIKRNMNEINDLQMQRNSMSASRVSMRSEAAAAAAAAMASDQWEQQSRRLDELEKENRTLKNDLHLLNEKLADSQKELKIFKNINETMQQAQQQQQQMSQQQSQKQQSHFNENYNNFSETEHLKVICYL